MKKLFNQLLHKQKWLFALTVAVATTVVAIAGVINTEPRESEAATALRKQKAKITLDARDAVQTRDASASSATQGGVRLRAGEYSDTTLIYAALAENVKGITLADSAGTDSLWSVQNDEKVAGVYLADSAATGVFRFTAKLDTLKSNPDKHIVGGHFKIVYKVNPVTNAATAIADTLINENSAGTANTTATPPIGNLGIYYTIAKGKTWDGTSEKTEASDSIYLVTLNNLPTKKTAGKPFDTVSFKLTYIEPVIVRTYAGAKGNNGTETASKITFAPNGTLAAWDEDTALPEKDTIRIDSVHTFYAYVDTAGSWNDYTGTNIHHIGGTIGIKYNGNNNDTTVMTATASTGWEDAKTDLAFMADTATNGKDTVYLVKVKNFKESTDTTLKVFYVNPPKVTISRDTNNYSIVDKDGNQIFTSGGAPSDTVRWANEKGADGKVTKQATFYVKASKPYGTWSFKGRNSSTHTDVADLTTTNPGSGGFWAEVKNSVRNDLNDTIILHNVTADTAFHVIYDVTPPDSVIVSATQGTRKFDDKLDFLTTYKETLAKGDTVSMLTLKTAAGGATTLQGDTLTSVSNSDGIWKFFVAIDTIQKAGIPSVPKLGGKFEITYDTIYNSGQGKPKGTITDTLAAYAAPNADKPWFKKTQVPGIDSLYFIEFSNVKIGTGASVSSDSVNLKVSYLAPTEVKFTKATGQDELTDFTLSISKAPGAATADVVSDSTTTGTVIVYLHRTGGDSIGGVVVYKEANAVGDTISNVSFTPGTTDSVSTVTLNNVTLNWGDTVKYVVSAIKWEAPDTTYLKIDTATVDGEKQKGILIVYTHDEDFTENRSITTHGDTTTIGIITFYALIDTTTANGTKPAPHKLNGKFYLGKSATLTNEGDTLTAVDDFDEATDWEYTAEPQTGRLDSVIFTVKIPITHGGTNGKDTIDYALYVKYNDPTGWKATADDTDGEVKLYEADNAANYAALKTQLVDTTTTETIKFWVHVTEEGFVPGADTIKIEDVGEPQITGLTYEVTRLATPSDSVFAVTVSGVPVASDDSVKLKVTFDKYVAPDTTYLRIDTATVGTEKQEGIIIGYTHDDAFTATRNISNDGDTTTRGIIQFYAVIDTTTAGGTRQAPHKLNGKFYLGKSATLTTPGDTLQVADDFEEADEWEYTAEPQAGRLDSVIFTVKIPVTKGNNPDGKDTIDHKIYVKYNDPTGWIAKADDDAGEVRLYDKDDAANYAALKSELGDTTTASTIKFWVHATADGFRKGVDSISVDDVSDDKVVKIEIERATSIGDSVYVVTVTDVPHASDSVKLKVAIWKATDYYTLTIIGDDTATVKKIGYEDGAQSNSYTITVNNLETDSRVYFTVRKKEGVTAPGVLLVTNETDTLWNKKTFPTNSDDSLKVTIANENVTVRANFIRFPIVSFDTTNIRRVTDTTLITISDTHQLYADTIGGYAKYRVVAKYDQTYGLFIDDKETDVTGTHLGDSIVYVVTLDSIKRDTEVKLEYRFNAGYYVTFVTKDVRVSSKQKPELAVGNSPIVLTVPVGDQFKFFAAKTVAANVQGVFIVTSGGRGDEEGTTPIYSGKTFTAADSIEVTAEKDTTYFVEYKELPKVSFSTSANNVTFTDTTSTAPKGTANLTLYADTFDGFVKVRVLVDTITGYKLVYGDKVADEENEDVEIEAFGGQSDTDSLEYVIKIADVAKNTDVNFRYIAEGPFKVNVYPQGFATVTKQGESVVNPGDTAKFEEVTLLGKAEFTLGKISAYTSAIGRFDFREVDGKRFWTNDSGITNVEEDLNVIVTFDPNTYVTVEEAGELPVNFKDSVDTEHFTGAYVTEEGKLKFKADVSTLEGYRLYVDGVAYDSITSTVAGQVTTYTVYLNQRSAGDRGADSVTVTARYDVANTYPLSIKAGTGVDKIATSLTGDNVNLINVNEATDKATFYVFVTSQTGANISITIPQGSANFTTSTEVSGGTTIYKVELTDITEGTTVNVEYVKRTAQFNPSTNVEWVKSVDETEVTTITAVNEVATIKVRLTENSNLDLEGTFSVTTVGNGSRDILNNPTDKLRAEVVTKPAVGDSTATIKVTGINADGYNFSVSYNVNPTVKIVAQTGITVQGNLQGAANYGSYTDGDGVQRSYHRVDLTLSSALANLKNGHFTQSATGGEATAYVYGEGTTSQPYYLYVYDITQATEVNVNYVQQPFYAYHNVADGQRFSISSLNSTNGSGQVQYGVDSFAVTLTGTGNGANDLKPGGTLGFVFGSYGDDRFTAIPKVDPTNARRYVVTVDAPTGNQPISSLTVTVGYTEPANDIAEVTAPEPDVPEAPAYSATLPEGTVMQGDRSRTAEQNAGITGLSAYGPSGSEWEYGFYYKHTLVTGEVYTNSTINFENTVTYSPNPQTVTINFEGGLAKVLPSITFEMRITHHTFKVVYHFISSKKLLEVRTTQLRATTPTVSYAEYDAENDILNIYLQGIDVDAIGADPTTAVLTVLSNDEEDVVIAELNDQIYFYEHPAISLDPDNGVPSVDYSGYFVLNGSYPTDGQLRYRLQNDTEYKAYTGTLTNSEIDRLAYGEYLYFAYANTDFSGTDGNTYENGVPSQIYIYKPKTYSTVDDGSAPDVTNPIVRRVDVQAAEGVNLLIEKENTAGSSITGLTVNEVFTFNVTPDPEELLPGGQLFFQFFKDGVEIPTAPVFTGDKDTDGDGVFNVAISRIKTSGLLVIVDYRVATGNASVQTAKAWTNDGKLFITSNANGTAKVFAINGTLVKIVKLEAGITNVTDLPNGNYIIALPTGKTEKVNAR
jgi:hypothetical protein